MYAIKWRGWVVKENISIGTVMYYLMFDCDNAYNIEHWVYNQWYTVVNVKAHNYDWVI
jgi:hypothetical protein